MIDVRSRIDDELEFIDLNGLMSTHGTKQLKDVLKLDFKVTRMSLIAILIR